MRHGLVGSFSVESHGFDTEKDERAVVGGVPISKSDMEDMVECETGDPKLLEMDV
jgi:hypothetical protein